MRNPQFYVSGKRPIAGGGIQNDNWTELNQNNDSVSVHDTVTAQIFIELGYLARVKKFLVHLLYYKNEAMFIIFIHIRQL